MGSFKSMQTKLTRTVGIIFSSLQSRKTILSTMHLKREKMVKLNSCHKKKKIELAKLSPMLKT